MLNKENERELCYVVKINDITPIEGADRVELAHINGWQVMVRKGQFAVGDAAIYFEIDSKVPETEPFAFLASKDYKVKTQKYFKGTVISQGLIMAAEDFGWKTMRGVDDSYLYNENDNVFYNEGYFLTKQLGVTYAEALDNVRKSASIDKYKRMVQRNPSIFSYKSVKWLMKREWGRKCMFFLFGKPKDKKNTWPIWVNKTDEERIENMPWILNNKNSFIATEKLDGTSTTFTMRRKRFGKTEFLVCSRNVVFDKPDKNCFYDTNVYTEMAEKYNIEYVLYSILKDHPEYDWVTLQGETYGTGIQNRNYGLDEHRFAGFNFITSKEGRWNSVAAADFMSRYNVPWVPIIDKDYVLPDSIEELRAFSHSAGSAVDGGMKEGIVFRSQDGLTSFKCVDPEYLLKYHG